MFTCLQRRHYNKAPLFWINMCAHFGNHCPQLLSLLQNHLNISDEYPVENTHSILRAQTNSSDTAADLTKKAKSSFQSKVKQSNFRSYFTPPKQFSFSHDQLRYLKVRCAQTLSSLIIKLSSSPGSSMFCNRNAKVHDCTHILLPNLCSDTPMKTKVLPLGFNTSIKPEANKRCDLPGCLHSGEEWKILNGCWHSFHAACLEGFTGCPLCKEYLKEKIKQLGEIAKDAILTPTPVPKTMENVIKIIPMKVQKQLNK